MHDNVIESVAIDVADRGPAADVLIELPEEKSTQFLEGMPE